MKKKTKGIKASETNEKDDFPGIEQIGYNETFRTMLKNGVKWLNKHQNANPKFKGFKGIRGIIINGNEDAKSLSNAITSDVGNSTGVMHHAAINDCMLVRRDGWKKYIKKMIEIQEA